MASVESPERPLACIRRIPIGDGLMTASPDGRYVVNARETDVCVIDVFTGVKRVFTTPEPNLVGMATFCKGHLVFDSNEHIFVYETAGWTFVHAIHTGGVVWSVVGSLDVPSVLVEHTGGPSPVVEINVITGEQIGSFDYDDVRFVGKDWVVGDGDALCARNRDGRRLELTEDGDAWTPLGSESVLVIEGNTATVKNLTTGASKDAPCAKMKWAFLSQLRACKDGTVAAYNGARGGIVVGRPDGATFFLEYPDTAAVAIDDFVAGGRILSTVTHFRSPVVGAFAEFLLQSPFWTKDIHRYFDPAVRAVIRTFLLCCRRARVQMTLPGLPPEMSLAVLGFYDVTRLAPSV